jgi:adenylate cyclase
MAGVIGVNKISYDVWGDTVNLASRLEQLASADHILISHEVMEQLGREFEASYQGEVQIKGLGRGEAWVLDGSRAGRGYLH